jgi:hypothetical protein
MAARQKFKALCSIKRAIILERAKGIEPSYAAWEAAVLPLNYARLGCVAFYPATILITMRASSTRAILNFVRAPRPNANSKRSLNKV